MFKFVLKRILQMIPTILGMTFIGFVVIKLAPGDFLSSLELNPSYSKETIEELKKLYGLDENIFVQYFKWLFNAITFNLGYSFAYHKPVSELISERLLNTLSLTVSSFVLSWAIGIPLGVYSAMKSGKLADKIIRAYSYLGISVPNFFVAFLLMLFSAKTGILPIGGIQSFNFEELSFFGKITDRIHHMLLPLTVLVFGSSASLVRLVRNTVMDELKKDYVLLARAKGLPERRILFVHVLKNAMSPFYTLIGFDIANLLSGAVLIEIITSWPGIGRLMFDAVMSQDFFVVMGSLYIGGLMLLAGNLFADIMLAINDPRVREREVEGKEVGRTA